MYKIILLLVLLPFFYSAQLHLKVTEITPNSLTFTSQGEGSFDLFYTENKDFSNPILQEGKMKLTDLKPATVYYVQARRETSKDTLLSEIGIFATQSKSSGNISVFFNSPVNNSICPYADALQTNLEDTLVGYINLATQTLDICMYNMGSSNIVSAINAAEQRGVTVRYIGESSTSNSALGSLSGTIPVLQRNDGDIMHNKIYIIDRNIALNAHVVCGSTNNTSANLFDDPNNVVAIQDQTLAAAYTLEFEEMWGTSAATPDLGNIKFGPDKTDNTPHTFNIGGINVECYFSPSDGTTDQIVNTLNTANHDMMLALLHFTRNEPGDEVIDRINAGVDVKGIIETATNFGSEFNSINNAGGNLLSHQTTSYFFHHKYAIIDGLDASSDPIVLTGSHNWTTAAEEDNDENTLIIHDATIAGEYVEEFQQHFSGLGGVGNFTFQGTSVQIENSAEKKIKYFPNPSSNGVFYIESTDKIERLEIYSILGEKMKTINNPGNEIYHELIAGLYLIKVFTKSNTIEGKILITN